MHTYPIQNYKGIILYSTSKKFNGTNSMNGTHSKCADTKQHKMAQMAYIMAQTAQTAQNGTSGAKRCYWQNKQPKTGKKWGE